MYAIKVRDRIQIMCVLAVSYVNLRQRLKLKIKNVVNRVRRMDLYRLFAARRLLLPHNLKGKQMKLWPKKVRAYLRVNNGVEGNETCIMFRHNVRLYCL